MLGSRAVGLGLKEALTDAHQQVIVLQFAFGHYVGHGNWLSFFLQASVLMQQQMAEMYKGLAPGAMPGM